ncbi:hypothetical protein ONZ51_g1975 [Trametes cubensis]|uniref:Uncharacterized protein n=1 Tax=Trametes cubensis TaxID=1111947 RepID=A0AAD7XFB0_9APHY|nr:hypothetical protein ONZ51_g1975 [Trametes cubensis]
MPFERLPPPSPSQAPNSSRPHPSPHDPSSSSSEPSSLSASSAPSLTSDSTSDPTAESEKLVSPLERLSLHAYTHLPNLRLRKPELRTPTATMNAVSPMEDGRDRMANREQRKQQQAQQQQQEDRRSKGKEAEAHTASREGKRSHTSALALHIRGLAWVSPFLLYPLRSRYPPRPPSQDVLLLQTTRLLRLPQRGPPAVHAPPPPAPVERTVSALPASTAPVVQIPTIEDPFADALVEDEAPLTPLPLPPSSTYSRNRVTVSTYTVPSDSSNSSTGSRGTMATGLSAPPGLAHMASNSIPSAKDMRGRLVASVLLSRGSGRPLGTYLRRRLSGQEHVYVKSGLSQLVAAAA